MQYRLEDRIDGEGHFSKTKGFRSEQNFSRLDGVGGSPNLNTAAWKIDPPGGRDAAVVHVGSHVLARFALAVADLDDELCI